MNTLFLDLEFGPIYGSFRGNYFPTEIGAVIYDVERHQLLFESKKLSYDVFLVIRKNIINDIGKTVGFSERVANLKRGEYQKVFDPSYRLEKSDQVIARKLRSQCLDELREYIHNLFKIHQVDQIVLFGGREDIKILKMAKVNISNIQVIDIQLVIEKEIGYLFSLDKISLIIGFYAKNKCFGSKNFNYKLPLKYKNKMKPHSAFGDACRIFIVCKEFCAVKSELVQQCNMYCEINKIPKANVNRLTSLNVLQSQPSSQLKVTLLLETLSSGKVSASIFEFPQCRVEAASREEAITKIQTTFLERLKHIETLSWEVPIQASEPAWMQFAGVFKDDPDFQEIMDDIRAERTSDDDSEIDSLYYL
ncbi:MULTISPECIES: hypothetical protein [unclassified Microcoleus]|uniref:hypothetical protein n=1 Tax=unclassified Microcoleus TaxID=2642155 RepID=UPI002FD5DD02